MAEQKDRTPNAHAGGLTLSRSFRSKPDRIPNPNSPWMVFKYIVEDTAEDHNWSRRIKERVWERMDSNPHLINTNYSVIDMAKSDWVPPPRLINKPGRVYDPLKEIREQIAAENVCANIAEEIYGRIDADPTLLKSPNGIFGILGWDRRRLQFENKLRNAPVFSPAAETQLRNMYLEYPEKFDSPDCNLFDILGSVQTKKVTITIAPPLTAMQIYDGKRREFHRQCWIYMSGAWQREIKSDPVKFQKWKHDTEVIWIESAKNGKVYEACKQEAAQSRAEYKNNLKKLLKDGLKKH